MFLIVSVAENHQTTVYWTSKDDIQVVCGCFKSNLDDFEVRVNKVHANNPQYLKEYLKLIEVVKISCKR